jgi:chemotaxis protein methyltransferase CheR
MDDVAFLQWALPRLHLRWPGFRRVRGQVCKRIVRRMKALDVDGWAGYAAYLERHPDEWALLDGLCRVTISRFYRDRGVFQHLADEILPLLAQRVVAAGGDTIRCWSAGCASGEEPYTLAIVWRRCVQPAFPGLRLRIVATDVDPVLLARARAGLYRPGTLKELPAALREAAFEPAGDLLRVRDEFRDAIELRQEDIRMHQPDEQFQLVLCRNLVFTYFDAPLQQRLLAAIGARLAPGGVLVIGRHEHFPSDAPGWRHWDGDDSIWATDR